MKRDTAPSTPGVLAETLSEKTHLDRVWAVGEIPHKYNRTKSWRLSELNDKKTLTRDGCGGLYSWGTLIKASLLPPLSTPHQQHNSPIPFLITVLMNKSEHSFSTNQQSRQGNNRASTTRPLSMKNLCDPFQILTQSNPSKNLPPLSWSQYRKAWIWEKQEQGARKFIRSNRIWIIFSILSFTP